MKQIKFSDFQVIPLINTARRADISDEVYFGPKYANYISNSKLSNICKSQGGSMQKYYGPSVHLDTSSLALGTVVHCCTLQPNDFTLAPKCGKPSAKLGKACECYVKYLKEGLDEIEAARKACLEANYYVNQIDKHINTVITSGNTYYENIKDYDSSILTLDDRSWDTATKCIENLKNDTEIQSKLNPVDIFDNPISSFNEDTLFLDFLVIYNRTQCVTLHIKGKLDNWTIDEESKILTLNDLKTTGHPVAWFHNREYGSLYKYHYLRQLALYKIMLESLCSQKYGYNRNQWGFKSNILAVQTVEECNTRCIYISDKQLQQGETELMECLKSVGYYELFGHEEEVKFV